MYQFIFNFKKFYERKKNNMSRLLQMPIDKSFLFNSNQYGLAR